MKKILLIGLLVVAMAASAHAWIGIDWRPGWGIYDMDSPDVSNFDNANSLLSNSSAIWQLIYAGANDAVDPYDTSEGDPGIQDNYVTGDDVVWGERVVGIGGGTAADGTDWDTWLLWQGAGDSAYENTSWDTAGFVYQRIFEGSPIDGVQYTSPLFAYNPNWWDGTGTKPLPELMFTENGTGSTPTAGVQTVPEPATMGLLGLGALVMAIRRRRS